MPVIGELRSLLRDGHLHAGRTVLLHPEDFRELLLAHDETLVLPRRSDPTTLFESETIFGVRIISSPHQRQGHVSVLENVQAWSAPLRFPTVTSPPNANGDVLPPAGLPDLLAQVYARHVSSIERHLDDVISGLSLGGTRGAGGIGALGSGGDGGAGCVVIEEWPEEEPSSPPKSLWQRLEEDE